MSEVKARKLAKSLGFQPSKEKRTEREWSALVIEWEAEKKYNHMTDDFQKKKAEIFAKRNMKMVIKELKDYKRNRIELTIPVERTDPPTVNKAVIANKLGDVNMANYTISFSMTTTTQTLDENGNLESEKVETSEEKAITSAAFLKKYEKRTAGALTGFLNQYMIKMKKSLQFVNRINLVLIKKIRNKRALTPNFDGMTTNCLIDIVDKLVQKRREYAKKLKPRLDELNEKYFAKGCAEDAIDEICKAVQVNIHVVSVLQETWYHKHLGDNKKTILICSHNGHAIWMNDDHDMTDFLVPEKTKKCTYIHGVTQHFLENKQALKFPIVIKDQIVSYYDYEGNLYKNRDIFFDEEDWLKNKENEKLQNVFTLTSRYYKELKDKYHIQDLYRDEELYYFVKCADLYSPAWCTDADYAENGQAFDQTRAYMFYEKSEFYAHYQFPRMPTHFYKLNEKHKSLEAELLQKTGFAQVQNVKIPGNKQLQFIRETQMVQDNGVYTTMRLAWLASLGVTFDLIRVAFANDKQQIDFHIKLTEWQENTGLSCKAEECSLMGRLIPNQNAVHTSLVHCQDENEFLQLRYQLGDRVLNVDFEKKIIYYANTKVMQCQDEQEFKHMQLEFGSQVYNVDTERKIIYYTDKTLRGAYHIHAYILDYQQIEFATKAMTVPFDTILKVKVDCLVLRTPTMESVARELHEHSKGAWAVSAIMEWMETMDHIPITELKPFHGWEGSIKPTLDIPYKWGGFHEEREIKDCKTAFIEEVDFTHRQYRLLPKLTELPLIELDDQTTSPTLHQFNNVTGAAGTGKSHMVTNLGMYDCCMLVPNHALRVKFRDEHPEMPCMSYHKMFNTNVKKGEYRPDRRVYSTYLMDECSMICKGVMNNNLTDKNAKDANFVLIHDQAQLAAVTPENSKWEDPKSRYFTYGREFKKRKWLNIHLTKQMRQTDPAFSAILDKIRDMQDECKSLPKMIELLKDRIITEEECKKLYRMDTKDIVIASTNNEVDRWNKIFLKLAKPGELKLKYTTNTTNHVNNERIIMQTEQGESQVLAFASTIHIVQGLTFTDRLFISLSMLKPHCNFDPHLFYTAISRLKVMDNLYLVQ